MKRLLLLFSLLSLISIFSCQKLDPMDPAQEFKSIDNFGQFVDTTLYADSAFFVIDPYVLTNASEKISVGNFKGFKASFLIRFLRMPSDSNATYDSVFVILNRRHVFGKDADLLNLGVSVPTTAWTDSANLFPEWHTYQPEGSFYSFTTNAEDTETVNIPIPVDVFTGWVEDGADNKGLFIFPQDEQSTFITEFDNFYIEDPAKWPKLVYKKILPDTVEHDTTNIGYATTIFNYDVEGPQSIYTLAEQEKELIVSSGIGCRVLFHFGNLDAIPQKSIIYSADVILKLKDQDVADPTQPNVLSNGDHPQTFFLRMLKSVDPSSKQYEVDSLFASSGYYSYTLYQADSVLHFLDEDAQVMFGKSYLQNYISGRFTNTWFLLQYQNERMDISVKYIESILNKGIRIYARYYTVKSEGF